MTTCIVARPQLPCGDHVDNFRRAGTDHDGIGVLPGQRLIDRDPGRAPVIAAIHTFPAREVDACRHGASRHRARRCGPGRSRGDAPPLRVAPKDRRSPGDEGTRAVQIVRDGERRADQHVRRLHRPVAPAVARRQHTAVGRQQEVVGLRRADGEGDGPADEAAGVDREPGRPAVAGPKEPAPRARIVRARRAGPQRDAQGQEQGPTERQIGQRQGSDDVSLWCEPDRASRV